MWGIVRTLPDEIWEYLSDPPRRNATLCHAPPRNAMHDSMTNELATSPARLSPGDVAVSGSRPKSQSKGDLNASIRIED